MLFIIRHIVSVEDFDATEDCSRCATSVTDIGVVEALCAMGAVNAMSCNLGEWVGRGWTILPFFSCPNWPTRGRLTIEPIAQVDGLYGLQKALGV